MVTRTLVFGKDNWPTDYGDNNAGPDHITGTPAPNIINGGTGNDVIDGRGGDDIITGGGGADTLTGGPGNDTFVYINGLNSPASNPDFLPDFNPNEDVIDLQPVDADVTTPGNQDFTSIGANPFSGIAGQLRIDPNTGTLEADRDGGGTADFVIRFGSNVPDAGANVNALVHGTLHHSLRL